MDQYVSVLPLALAAAKQDQTLLQTDFKRLLLETASPEAAAGPSSCSSRLCTLFA
jgi:hypothetical protein